MSDRKGWTLAVIVAVASAALATAPGCIVVDDESDGEPTIMGGSGFGSSGDPSSSSGNGPTKKTIGQECADKSECEGGKCLQHNGSGFFCTHQCIKADDCPTGWVCDLDGSVACVPAS